MAATILLSGLLIFLICLPLIYRKVPMNSTYGIRIAAAFESEQRWYDINAFGGRCLAAWSWLIIAAGVAGFFVSPEHKEIYALGSVVVALLSVGIPVIQIVRWSRKT
jgi:hypothetical protein